MIDDVHQLRGIRLKGIKRDPSHFLGDCKVEQAHLDECFDADTLFYDIFFEPTNRHLVAVGPPLGILRIALEIYVNGKPIEHTVLKRASRQMHLVRGPVSRVEKLNDVLVKANGHQWQLSVPQNNTGTGHKWTLCSLQKNNKEHWIKDWIEHYRKMGVDRVILYDNNSDKLPDVDAIVIPCPYKFGLSKYVSIYGPPVWITAFLQRSLPTICCYKYRSGHLLNFDIDELLQVKSLEKYKKRKLAYFDSYYIETKADGKLPKDYSFRHFIYRNAHMRNKVYNYKYTVKMEVLLYSQDQHCALVKLSVPRRIALKLKRIWSYLGRRINTGRRCSKSHPWLSDDVFYHYKGINTGWKHDRSSFDETTEVVKIENSRP